jgi:hypothetical protein
VNLNPDGVVAKTEERVEWREGGTEVMFATLSQRSIATAEINNNLSSE